MDVQARLSVLRERLKLAGVVLSFFATVPFMRMVAWSKRKPENPWVISGHRGRIYADNAAAVHKELVRQGQPVIWISDNDEVTAELRAKGQAVLKRNSLEARWAMLTAPVLIYSHGESDIDLLQILLRYALGLRIHLNHCMNHVKAGDYHSPVYQKLWGPRKWFYQLLVTDFDYCLASSESERENFKLAYPKRAFNIRLGGGAHLDAFIHGVNEGKRTNDIVYFPTFRDDASGRRALEGVIEELLNSERLQAWLEEKDLRLKIGAHINTGSYSVEGKGRIEWLPPSGIVEAMCTTRGFISDYSGLIVDALVLKVPVMFFPFDLDEYLQTRWLFHPYEKLAYGPTVRTAEELIELLVSGRWEDMAPYAERRRAFREEVIPDLEPTYAQRSVQTIRDILEEGKGW